MLKKEEVPIAENKTSETLETFITKDWNFKISHNARFQGFQHRSKVEFLKFFIV